MSTIAPENRGGNHTLADYIPPSDQAQCPRCGIWRKARPGATICADCKTVEHHAGKCGPDEWDMADWQTIRGPAGIVRFVRAPEPLSDEDWAWCRAQETRGLLIAWQRANRAGGDERLQRAVERTWAA